MHAVVDHSSDWHAIHHARFEQICREERWNALTHGIGAVLSVVGAMALVWTAALYGNGWQLAGCTSYGASLIGVYLASTLSHVYHDSVHRRLFRRIDQACIFLLIAGSFTPLAVTYLPQGIWWLIPAAMWVVAGTGFVAKLVLAHRIESVTIWLHLTLGWFPLATALPMLTNAPRAMIAWFFAGGVCYTAGTIFLKRDHRPYFHVVWHLLVMAGSACHYWTILAYCTVVPG